jgi:hypothetical protein
MFRDFYLRLAKKFLKITNAKRRSCEQIENPESCLVGKTLVDLGQVHRV